MEFIRLNDAEVAQILGWKPRLRHDTLVYVFVRSRASHSGRNVNSGSAILSPPPRADSCARMPTHV